MDVAEVLSGLEHLRRQMGTGDRAKIADGVRRLRDAARKVSDSLRPRRTGDAARHVGNFTRRVSIAEINRRNRGHAAKNAAPALDASGRMVYPRGATTRTADSAPVTEVRDAEHAVRSATTPRELNAAMNRAARALWSGNGEPSSVTSDMLRSAPAPKSIAEMNQRARAFWAGR